MAGGKTDLIFDVKAVDSASKAFGKVAAAVEALEKKIDALDGKKAKVTVEVDVKDDKLDKLRGDLDGLKDRDVKVKVSVDDKDLDRLKNVDRSTGGGRGRDAKAEIEVDADTAGAAAALKAIEKQADQLDGKKVKVGVEVDQKSVRTAAQAFAAARAAGDDAAARLGGSSARSSATRDVDRLRDAFPAVAQGIGSFVSGASKGFAAVARGAGQASEAIFGIGGGLADVATQGTKALPGVIGGLLKVGTVGGAVLLAGEGIAVAWGAASTALAAAPAAVAAIGIPVAAVALGFEGIKKAAQTLKPEFEAMRTAVSATFEKGLVPAFQTLRKVMPTVQAGMVDVANAMSAVTRNVADFVASPEGIKLVGDTFKGVAGAIRDMSPGLVAATKGLLTLTAQPAAFDAMSESVNRFGTAFEQSVTKLVGSGAMTRAFQGLGDVVGSVGEGFVSLVENGIELFAGAAPGVSSFVKDLTGFFNQVNWESVGTSVGQVFDGIGKAFAAVPPETYRAFEDAMATAGQVFQDPQVQRAITDMINVAPTLLEGLSRTVKETITVVSEVVRAAEPLVKAYNAVDDAINKAFESARTTGDQLYENVTKPFYDRINREKPALAQALSMGDVAQQLGAATVEWPVTVVPKVQMAAGAVGAGAAAILQGFGDFAGIQIDPMITVNPQVQIAQGAIAAAAQTVAGALGGLSLKGEVAAQIQVVPQVQVAQGAIASAAATIMQGFGSFTGLTVNPTVSVVPQVQVAQGAIAAAAASLMQSFGAFTLGQVDASVTVNPVPQIGQLTPPPPPPPPPPTDVPWIIGLTPQPQVGQMPAPPAPPPPPPMNVPLPLIAQPQWGSVSMPPAPQVPAPPAQTVPVSISYQPRPQPMQAPPAPTVSPVSTSQTVNVAQQTQVTPPPTPAAPSIAAVHTTQTVYVRQVTVTTASTGAIAGATAGSAQVGAQPGAGMTPLTARVAGGGVVGFAGGGPVRFPGGGVLPGYSPGRDSIPAILSRGEAVLVPELVKQLGAGNIMAANYAASRRQPAALPMAAGGATGRASWPMPRTGRAPTGPGTVRLEPKQLVELAGLLREGRPAPVAITVNDQSGNPVETARATQLALRMARS